MVFEQIFDLYVLFKPNSSLTYASNVFFEQNGIE